MTVYNKLVRDRIPQIISSCGEIPHTRILEDKEYRALLEAKLDEEVSEFHQERNLEELADILEVLYALAEPFGGREELMRHYERKHAARGGFQNRVFLISKEEA